MIDAEDDIIIQYDVWSTCIHEARHKLLTGNMVWSHKSVTETFASSPVEGSALPVRLVCVLLCSSTLALHRLNKHAHVHMPWHS